MTKVFLALAVALPLAACGSAETKPGNPAVYTRIAALNDCGRLQTEFDTAMTNHDRTGSDVSLAYAEAAQARIEAIKCP